MDMTKLKIARWHIRRWLGCLTWPWLGAGALLAFAIGFYVSMVSPARNGLESMHHTLLALQKEIGPHSAGGSIRPSASSQLAVFYQFFPSERSMPDWTEKILAAVAKNKLTLRQGEYQVSRDKNGKLLSYQVTLPVKGSYLDLRRFIDDLLTGVPIASLDNVKFERQKIGDNAVEATLLLTLHLGRES